MPAAASSRQPGAPIRFSGPEAQWLLADGAYAGILRVLAVAQGQRMKAAPIRKARLAWA